MGTLAIRCVRKGVETQGTVLNLFATQLAKLKPVRFNCILPKILSMFFVYPNSIKK